MAFNPDQPRDEEGMWTDEGDSNATDAAYDKRAMKLATSYAQNVSVRNASEAKTVLDYLGNSADWNNSLRGRMGVAPGVNKTNLDALIARATPLKENMTLYRGMSSEDVKVNSSGFISDKGYVSTTTRRSVAADFAEGVGGAGRGTILKIDVPAGARVLEIRSIEREMILPRNAKFKMLGVNRDNRNRYLEYHVRYVPDKRYKG